MVPPIVIGAHPKRREHGPIELGIAVSRLTHAPIDLVGTYWFDATPQRTASDDYSRVLSDDVQEMLEHAVRESEGERGEVRVTVSPGSASHVLQEKAEEVGAGLIIVGSTHRGNFGRIALGTTADKVLDRAPCPVAIVPRGWTHGGEAPRRVGVAFVDTPGGRSALRAAAAIAEGTGASLIAYTIIDPGTHESDRQGAVEAVERAVADYSGGTQAEYRVLESGGVEALIAESPELDFLVRGGRNRGAVRRPLAREVPAKLAADAACPLLVVPPGREEPLMALFGAAAGRENALSG